jgi:hypothetical protein
MFLNKKSEPTMKMIRYISCVFASLMMMSTLLTSCDEDGNGMELDSPDGKPVVKYVRVADPDQSDSLLVSATLGSGIVIIGENLGGTREVWFNDQQATLTPTWVTNTSVFANVPSFAPNKVTDMIYLVDANGDTLAHPFVVAIPDPVIEAAVNEWPQEGENLVIMGNYFFAPLTVTFTGGVTGEVVSVSQTAIEVTVPDGATEGPVTVTTNFGEQESTFHLWDRRNTILNFDDKLANGWRIGLRENADNAIDGNYLVVRGNIAANQRDEGPGAPSASPLAMEYWGGNDASRDGNFYPLYPNSYRDYVLKFEAKINSWYGGHLNICFSTPEHTGNNQEIWSNSLNARAIWAPWTVEGEEVSTEGQWITVVVPLTEFQYYMGSGAQGVFYTPGQKFVETAAGSLSTWFLGSPENDGNFVEFYIDNIRIVEP